MSQPTGKDLKGLMEAYASIYKQEEVVVEQEIHQEQFEINEEVLYESMIVYLVEFGYASTEKQAVNMLPHLSERWATNIAVEIIINETFVDSVNLLVDEGYDLSSHTWEELYEQYVENLNNILIQEGVENLHEALPLLIPAGAAMAPFAKAALLGGALYAGKKALDAYQNLRGRTSPEGERFLNAPLPTTKPKVKPTTVVKSQSGDVNLDNPSGSATSPKLKQSNVSSPATGGGGSGGKPPSGGKDPKWKEILLGKTTAGRVVRGVGTAAAADVAGTAYDPSKYSATSGGLGLASGALSLPFQGFAGVERFGKGVRDGAPLFGRGAYEQGQRTGIGQFARGTGETLGNMSQTMLTQPWRKSTTPPPPPTPPPTSPPSGSQGMTPMFRGNKIVGYR